MEYFNTILAAAGLAAGLTAVVLLLRLRRTLPENKRLDALEGQLIRMQELFRDSLQGVKSDLLQVTQMTAQTSAAALSAGQRQAAEQQDARLRELTQSLHTQLGQNGQHMEALRASMEQRLGAMQGELNRQMAEIRATVDEKLQKTLETRIGESFQLVNQRLEQVYRGLGEMQTLAAGVGDLKKVLSNVKTRGILGEIQLGAILEEILSPEQYAVNIVTKKGSGKPVEYAVRLPGLDEGTVYLPIDAKFPADTYSALMDAYDSANPAAVEAAAATLTRAIRGFAKDIHEKYIDPPDTTEFGILFLPFEGLYAEAVRLGLVETLQREYKISLAGPTTMAALLNSLQMGFRTLAIQKRSGEVWRVLGAVKTEFDKFAAVLENTQKRLDQANKELDTLVGTRTRVIRAKLRTVATLPEEESGLLLEGGEEIDSP